MISTKSSNHISIFPAFSSSVHFTPLSLCMDLSPRKMEKAGEAIDFLSSLPGTSGGSTPGTSTDSGNLSQLFNRVFSPHPHTKFYSAINFYNYLKFF